MSLRPARAGDVGTILRHRRRMYLDMRVATEESADVFEDASRAYLEAALRDGGYYGLLAETADGEVVAGGGVLIARWPGSPANRVALRAWILNIYVEPAWRRQGLARRVMEALLEWCRGQGFQSVALHASAEGRPLYEKLGFKSTNEMRLTF